MGYIDATVPFHDLDAFSLSTKSSITHRPNGIQHPIQLVQFIPPRKHTHPPPPPLPPLNHLPPYSSPAPHRHPNLVVPFSLSLKYHTLHKHIHPHHLPSVPLLLYHPRDTSIATVVIVIIRCHRGHRHRLWIYDAVQDRCGAVWKLDPARSWM